MSPVTTGRDRKPQPMADRAATIQRYLCSVRIAQADSALASVYACDQPQVATVLLKLLLNKELLPQSLHGLARDLMLKMTSKRASGGFGWMFWSFTSGEAVKN